MSKSNDPPKHCCCCRDHGHGALAHNSNGHGLPRPALPKLGIKQSFPGSYNAAAKYLASGLQMDYQKLSEDFDEASKATTENIMDILHDISSYDIFILERDATWDGRSGCSDNCNDCNECSGRRRARPDTKDLVHLQMSIRHLFDLIYQNFFHRILCPRKDQIDDAHLALVTPLHRVFIMHERPKHKDWEKELEYFERCGSGSVRLPLKTNERLPKGCPASLCFSSSQDIIDEFIDRVLCSTQVLHEKYNSTHHHTTEVTLTDDVCAICDRSAAWLLPALVAPWFIHRNMMKRETLASLNRSPDIKIPSTVLDVLRNAPSNFPSFPPPPEPLPPLPKSSSRRRPKKSQTVLMPNPPLYLGYLLPYYRLPFQPVENPDPVRHPYSYFLSLDPQKKKAHIQKRAQKTREELGFESPPTEKDPPVPWQCGWLTATECGLHAEDWIMDKEKLVALKQISSLNHLKTDSKPWEKLQMTETEFFGKGGFEAWGKRIADAAEQIQNTPGGSAILRDVGALMESVGALPPTGSLGKGKKK